MVHEYLNKIQRKNKQRELEKKQKEVNLLFEKEGLTDIVLDKQIEINQERCELDLPDESEFVYEEFVQ